MFTYIDIWRITIDILKLSDYSMRESRRGSYTFSLNFMLLDFSYENSCFTFDRERDSSFLFFLNYQLSFLPSIQETRITLIKI